MKENKYFSDKQVAFWGGRSMVLKLLILLDKWIELLDRVRVVDILYYDFMKAFDKVPHRYLFSKIQSYRISGNILTWIKGFLTKRQEIHGTRVLFILAKSSEWHSTGISTYIYK